MSNFWRIAGEIEKLSLQERMLLRMKLDQSIAAETGVSYEVQIVPVVEPAKTPLYKQGYEAGLQEAVNAFNAQRGLYSNWYGAASKFEALGYIAHANSGGDTAEVIKELSGDMMGYSKRLDSTIRQIQNRPLKVSPNVDGLEEFVAQIKTMEQLTRTFFDLSGQPDIAHKWFKEAIRREEFNLSDTFPLSEANIRGAKKKDKNRVTLRGEELVKAGLSYQGAANKIRQELEQELQEKGMLSKSDMNDLNLLRGEGGAEMLRRRIDRKQSREKIPRTN